MCYTGHLFEEEVLGSCRGSWDGKSYLTYRESMRWVVRHQKWSPSDPSPRAANDLHASVALALGVEDFSSVMLFTAVGSPLDRLHGVDAFFVFEGRVVTIDVTLNPHKDQWKADIILHENDVESREALVAIAKNIARMLNSERRCSS